MSFDLRRATPERPAVLLVVLGVLGAIFTLLAVFALNQWWPVGPIDEGVALRAFEFSVDRPRFVDLLNSAAVAFSTVGCIIGLVGFLAHALWQRERRIAIWIVASGATALAGNALLKLVFRRERPLTVGTLNDIGGYSFPSGHAAGAGMFFTVAILVTIVLTGRGWRRRILIAIFSALGLFVAASRVLLGVHWTSDVAAGLVFGVGVTLGLWVLIVSDTVRFPTELAMLTGAGTKQVAVVLNPIKVGDVEDFKARTTAVAAARGWSAPLWFETT
ncbi:MAG: phosphatase PAP2 family protein, partial [Aeromicrobium sp.]